MTIELLGGETISVEREYETYKKYGKSYIKFKVSILDDAGDRLDSFTDDVEIESESEHEDHLDVVMVNYADTGCYVHYLKDGRVKLRKIPYRMWEMCITHDEVSAIAGITDAVVDIVRFKDEHELIQTINRFKTYGKNFENKQVSKPEDVVHSERHDDNDSQVDEYGYTVHKFDINELQNTVLQPNIFLKAVEIQNEIGEKLLIGLEKIKFQGFIYSLKTFDYGQNGNSYACWQYRSDCELESIIDFYLLKDYSIEGEWYNYERKEKILFGKFKINSNV